MANMTELTSRLEPFLLFARSSKGAAAAKVIENATSAPGVYVFSELLDQPNIQALQTDPNLAKHHRLLTLFAYGTLQDYRGSPDNYPSLSPGQLVKLKHLSLLTAALRNRSIPYDDLLSALDLSSIRELEDLIIDVIYAGLLGGKLHHQERVLHVDWVAGRDVSPEELRKIANSLSDWCKTSSTLLSALDNEIDHAQRKNHRDAADTAHYRQVLDQQYQVVLAETRSHGTGGGGNGGMGGRKYNTRVQSGSSEVDGAEQTQLFGSKSAGGGGGGGAGKGGSSWWSGAGSKGSITRGSGGSLSSGGFVPPMAVSSMASGSSPGLGTGSGAGFGAKNTAKRPRDDEKEP